MIGVSIAPDFEEAPNFEKIDGPVAIQLRWRRSITGRFTLYLW